MKAKMTSSQAAGFLSLLLAALGAGCVDIDTGTAARSSGSLNAVTNLTRAGTIDANIKVLEVDNRFGSVEVNGVKDGDGAWSWALTVRAQDDATAQAIADACRCVVENSGDRTRLSVSFPSSHDRVSFKSDWEIRLPKHVALESHNRFGGTTIAGLSAPVEAVGQNGPLTIRDIGGPVRGQTSFSPMRIDTVGPAVLQNQNGSIEVTGVDGELEARTSFASLSAKGIAGPARLKNQNGALEISGVQGPAELKTSFAALSAENVEGDAALSNQNGPIRARRITGSVDAHTSFAGLDIESHGRSLLCRNQNGRIRAVALSPELETVEAKTSFSSLELHIPPQVEPAVFARTSFGEIESDVPILSPPRGKDPFAQTAPDTPRVTLQNQNGNIRVIRGRSTSAAE